MNIESYVEALFIVTEYFHYKYIGYTSESFAASSLIQVW
jgi:hypothetical protein